MKRRRFHSLDIISDIADEIVVVIEYLQLNCCITEQYSDFESMESFNWIFRPRFPPLKKHFWSSPSQRNSEFPCQIAHEIWLGLSMRCMPRTKIEHSSISKSHHNTFWKTFLRLSCHHKFLFVNGIARYVRKTLRLTICVFINRCL